MVMMTDSQAYWQLTVSPLSNIRDHVALKHSRHLPMHQAVRADTKGALAGCLAGDVGDWIAGLMQGPSLHSMLLPVLAGV